MGKSSPKEMKPLVILLLCSTLVIARGSTGPLLNCYHEQEGSRYQECQMQKGYQTCFTKYDENQSVTMRGCSTKRPVFFVECENHTSGARNEQVCYCSFDFCNGSDFACRANICLCICTALIIAYIGK